MLMLDRLAAAVLLLLPGGLTVYLSFHAGGFFAGAQATVALLVIVVLVVRITTAVEPFAGFSWPVVAVAGALALLAGWTLVSGSWSDSPARATLEYDRALLYLMTFLLFGSVPFSSSRLAWMLRGLALGIAAVCLASLITRVAPDVWPIEPNIQGDRLSYPLTYWNALGLLAAIGITLCLHLSASLREPPWVRVLAAGLVPGLASAMLFTLSRGPVAALVVALAVYVLLGRPRGLIPAVLAIVPPTAVAVMNSYAADRLTGEAPTAPAAVSQGHDVLFTVAACTAAAALVRVLLLLLDSRLAALRLPPRLRPRALAATLAVPLVAAAVAAFALDAPAYVGRQYDRFVEGDVVQVDKTTANARGRLTDVGNNGRLAHWEVALDAFRIAPLRGSGAGTYQLLWARHRPGALSVVDGHSLYVEVLGELGLVGLALISIAIITALVFLTARVRGKERSRHAAVLAVAIAWALHAGIDWDWEMPAVTLWFFALAGTALAARQSEAVLRVAPAGLARILIGLALLFLAITPARAALSQHQLDRSVQALKGGDCPRAIDTALAASSAMAVRPEPWEVIGYCDAGLGEPRLGVRAFRKAIARDPNNWELYYGLALARGAARLDPRPAVRRALRLNPRNPIIESAAARFRTSSAARWKREANASQILIR